MGETTLTLSEEVKEQLEHHRHDDHDNWSDVLETMMAILPTYDHLRNDGCAMCDESPVEDKPLDEAHGVIHWYQAPREFDGGLEAHWFCSRECIADMDDKVKKFVPREPDRIRVGGYQVPAVEIEESITCHIDNNTMEVGIRIPGAFAETEDGYDYHGEPVYVFNQGDWVQSGVVESIIHEETYTGLMLGVDAEVEMSNHPSERERKKWKQRQAESGE